MSNKFIPNLSVTDGFDFVKKIWGSLPIPNVINSTTDLEELDKRIADLKAVEQWLNVNLSMLRATIQGLEVQRGTIATIKSFGASLTSTGDRSDPASMNEAALREAVNRMMAQQVAPPPVPQAEHIEPKIPEPPKVEPQSDTKKSTKAALEEAEESSKALISNATAWWGLLQDQLNKVATAAISGAGLNAEGEADPAAKGQTAKKATGTKAAAKPAAKSSASRSKTTGRKAGDK